MQVAALHPQQVAWARVGRDGPACQLSGRRGRSAASAAQTDRVAAGAAGAVQPPGQPRHHPSGDPPGGRGARRARRPRPPQLPEAQAHRRLQAGAPARPPAPLRCGHDRAPATAPQRAPALRSRAECSLLRRDAGTAARQNPAPCEARGRVLRLPSAADGCGGGSGGAGGQAAAVHRRRHGGRGVGEGAAGGQRCGALGPPAAHLRAVGVGRGVSRRLAPSPPVPTFAGGMRATALEQAAPVQTSPVQTAGIALKQAERRDVTRCLVSAS